MSLPISQEPPPPWSQTWRTNPKDGQNLSPWRSVETLSLSAPGFVTIRQSCRCAASLSRPESCNSNPLWDCSIVYLRSAAFDFQPTLKDSRIDSQINFSQNANLFSDQPSHLQDSRSLAIQTLTILYRKKIQGTYVGKKNNQDTFKIGDKCGLDFLSS